MSLSFEDDIGEEVNEFKLKKKETINPDVKNDLKITPKFLSSEERKTIYNEEIKKIELREKEREKICKENKRLCIGAKYNKQKNSGTYFFKN